MEWIYLLIGVLLGIIGASIWLNKRLKEATLAHEAQIDEVRSQKDKVTEDSIKSNAENEHLHKQIEEQKQQQQQLLETHKHQFEVIAQKITRESNEQLSKESRNSMEKVVAPLKEQLKQLSEATTAVNIRHGALKGQIEELQKQSISLGEEAKALTEALKGSKVQGDLGEMLLEMLLEQSGLKKGLHYSTQEQFQTEEGRRRPDVIVKMPEQRALVIDSKISLNSYQAYTQSSEHEDRSTHEQRFLTSIRSHIDGLKQKDYSQLPAEKGLQSPDYVLMFIPIEPAFLLALEKDKDLFNRAMKANIALVSPTTLMCILRTIQHMWRQSSQQQNYLEIAKVGGQIRDKLSTFLEAFEKIGKGLKTATESYEEGHKRLTSERKDDIPALAARIEELGATPKKELPERYLPNSKPQSETHTEATQLPSSPARPGSDKGTQGALPS